MVLVNSNVLKYLSIASIFCTSLIFSCRILSKSSPILLNWHAISSRAFILSFVDILILFTLLLLAHLLHEPRPIAHTCMDQAITLQFEIMQAITVYPVSSSICLGLL